MLNLSVSVRNGPTQRSFYQLENIASSLSVAELKKNILLKAGLDSRCQLELIYSCRPLHDEAILNTLENVESGIKTIYATVVKPEKVKAKELPESEQQQLFLAFRAAMTKPNFRQTLQNFSKPENIQSLTETVPGLADDEIALSMLQDWELLLHLAEPKIFEVLVQKHPALVDAASRMMNSVSESLAPDVNQRQRSSIPGWLARNLAADFEEAGMEEDPPQDQYNTNQEASRSQAAFGSGITPAQLAAALNFAQNSIRQPLPSGTTAQQHQRDSPGTSLQQPEQSTARIPNDAATSSFNNGLTPEMFTQALLQAMNQMGGGSNSDNASERTAMASSSGTNSNSAAEPHRDINNDSLLRQHFGPSPVFASLLPQMREYGITDDNLSLRALQATNGDVEAALNLIYAGLVDD